MNRYARWGIALVLLPIAACANNPPAAPVVAAPAMPPLAAADASFVTVAAQGGMAEIQEAQLAQKMSHNPHVVDFAAKMITDHTAANEQLKQIAMSKNATLPSAVNDMQMQQMTALQAEKGHKFDRDYVADQIAGHGEMLQLFQTESQTGTDPDLKKFATDTLPVIQQHLEMANHMAKAPMHKGMHHHHKDA